jgi:hypothetical protein
MLGFAQELSLPTQTQFFHQPEVVRIGLFAVVIASSSSSSPRPILWLASCTAQAHSNLRISRQVDSVRGYVFKKRGLDKATASVKSTGCYERPIFWKTPEIKVPARR